MWPQEKQKKFHRTSEHSRTQLWKHSVLSQVANDNREVWWGSLSWPRLYSVSAEHSPLCGKRHPSHLPWAETFLLLRHRILMDFFFKPQNAPHLLGAAPTLTVYHICQSVPNPWPLPLLAPSTCRLVVLNILHCDSLPYPAYLRMDTTSSALPRGLGSKPDRWSVIAVCVPKEDNPQSTVIRCHENISWKWCHPVWISPPATASLQSFPILTSLMVVPRILNTFSSISGYVNCRGFFTKHPHLTGELQRQGLHKLWCNWSWPHQLLQTPFSIVSRAWEGMDASRGPSSSEHTATSIGRPGNTQAPGRIQSLLYEKPSLWILQSPAEKPALTHRLLLFFEEPTLELICSLCTRQTQTLVGISVQMQEEIPHPAFSIHKDSVSSETTSRWD